MLDLITERTAAAGPAALRGLGLRAARPPLRAQPELLAVRRLPRHRRRRARQAELSAPRACARCAGASRRRYMEQALAGQAVSQRRRGGARASCRSSSCSMRCACARASTLRALQRAHRPAAVGHRRGRCARPSGAACSSATLQHACGPTARGFDFLTDLQALFLPARAARTAERAASGAFAAIPRREGAARLSTRQTRTTLPMPPVGRSTPAQPAARACSWTRRCSCCGSRGRPCPKARRGSAAWLQALIDALVRPVQPRRADRPGQPPQLRAGAGPRDRPRGAQPANRPCC